MSRPSVREGGLFATVDIMEGNDAMKQLKRIPVVVLLLVCFLCFAHPNAAQAGTVVTTEAAFTSQLSSFYLADFSGLIAPPATAGALGGTQAFSGNGYSYEARAGSDDLYAFTLGTTWALTDNLNGYTLNFDNFSTNVTAIGGLFFSTNSDGNLIDPIAFPNYTLTLLLSDSTTRTITDSFVGFLSPGVPITSLTITANCPAGESPCTNYPTVEDLYVGAAKTNNGSVPEPATFGLLGAGLIAGGLLRKRLSRV